MLKFCFTFITAIFLSAFGNAQLDSTDLNFYTNEIDCQTLDDTLKYGSVVIIDDVPVFSTEGFGKLIITLPYSDIESSYKISYEIFQMGEALTEEIIFTGSYLTSILNDPEYLTETLLNIPLCNVELDQTYTLYLNIEDQFGHVKSSILKTLTL